MRRIVLTAAAALLALTGAFCLAGCQPQSQQPQQSQEAVKTGSVEGTLVSFSGKDLVLQSNGVQYTFDVSTATIVAANMLSGDDIVVHFEGELTTDQGTANVKVTSVEDKGPTATTQAQQQAVGTLVNMSMNTITIKQNDGTELTFNSNNCEHNFVNGIREGNWIVVTYVGQIQGTDTQNVKVISITDNDPNTVQAEQQQMNIKAVDETVYATAGVHIRASYSTDSEVLGTLAQGASIHRTGVCDNGWSRVNYNGTDAYIYGDYLTTQAPQQDAQPAKTDGTPAATPQAEGGQPQPVQDPDPAPQPDPQPAATPDTTQTEPGPVAVETQTATGIVSDVTMNTLSFVSDADGQTYTVSIMDADHHYANGIQTGNAVKLVYTGDLSDPNNCTVLSVEDDDPNTAAQAATYTGTVVDATMNTVTIQTDDGISMTFGLEGANDTTGGLSTDMRITVTADTTAADDGSTIIPATQIDLAQ